MNRRQVKKEIFVLLEKHKPSELDDMLTKYPRISVINSLFMALCDTNQLVKWHAVSCFGQLVPTMARANAESARVIMRRFLWTLNDESGGIGWGAPEAMAQIMCNSDLLRKEYLHMLISYIQEDGDELYQDGNYLELPLLQRGVLWGIGTLCNTFPEEMKRCCIEKDLQAYFHLKDIAVQHLALWALSGLGARCSREEMATLDVSIKDMTIYQVHELTTIDVKRLYDSVIL